MLMGNQLQNKQEGKRTCKPSAYHLHTQAAAAASLCKRAGGGARSY